ncbi:hypothetical protein L484_014481 [Morus notabilis]|uniref:Uncharacterized protein n=1 Tax=Morus notabilis TaxID=981085 RepID=W9RWN0_9ROSA|nr:hypothetical protein L484_014481 [Morus notabilis]
MGYLPPSDDDGPDDDSDAGDAHNPIELRSSEPSPVELSLRRADPTRGDSSSFPDKIHHISPLSPALTPPPSESPHPLPVRVVAESY